MSVCVLFCSCLFEKKEKRKTEKILTKIIGWDGRNYQKERKKKNIVKIQQ